MKLLPFIVGSGTAILLLTAAKSRRQPAKKYVPLAELRDVLDSAKLGPGLSTNLLLALAWGESRLNLNDITGKHRGLWSLPPSALADYNRRSGETLTLRDLHQLLPSIRVARDHFATIVRSLRQAGLDLADPDWPGYVIAGHNAGYSSKRGLAGVAKRAMADGESVTFKRIPELAARYDGIEHLWNPEKVEYWSRVLSRFEGYTDEPE